MSSPFAPPPEETPTIVPPNRAPAASPLSYVLLIAVLLVVGFAVLQVLPRGGSTGNGLAWLLPLGTYALMAVVLLALRARLPAQYRSLELRELAPATPEPIEPREPLPIELTLLGTDTVRSVELRIDATGLHWSAAKRLLSPAQELHVPWRELESVSTARIASPLSTWGWVLGPAWAIGTWARPELAIPGVIVAVAMIAFGRRFSRGMLAFSTPTHALAFHSPALGPAVMDEIAAAVRSRKPSAAPPAASIGAFRALLVEPWLHLARALRPESTLRDELRREGVPETDPERALASRVQLRMFGVWSGFMRGVGPIAVAIAGGMGAGNAAFVVMGGLAAWFAGLMIVGRTTELFARFSGMSVVR